MCCLSLTLLLITGMILVVLSEILGASLGLWVLFALMVLTIIVVCYGKGGTSPNNR